ncbi:C-type lectin fold [Trinorchestia longiramus]|nr:C-type lectin fold [Trinorchestia longiramus]
MSVTLRVFLDEVLNVMGTGKKILRICPMIWAIWHISMSTSVFATTNSSIHPRFPNNTSEEVSFTDILSKSLGKEKLSSVEKRDIPRSSNDVSDGKQLLSHKDFETILQEKSHMAVNSFRTVSHHTIPEKQSSANWSWSARRERALISSHERIVNEGGRLKQNEKYNANPVYNSGEEFRRIIHGTDTKKRFAVIGHKSRSLNFTPLAMRKTTAKMAALQSCSADANGECIVWQTGHKSWSEAHRRCRELGGFLLDRPATELLRNSSHISVSRPAWLGDSSTGTMTVKFRDFLLKNIRVHAGFSKDLMWTGLTRHRGHYQWMTRVPSVEAVVDWEAQEEFPERFRPDCPALSVTEEGTSATFRLAPCDAELPFACHLQPPHAESRTQIASELSSGALELQVSSSSSVQFWTEVFTEQFFELELNCGLFNTSSGETVPLEKLEVFWTKDDVYLGINSTSIHPADMHDPTKSGFIPLSISLDLLVPTKQGTFSCEVWDLQNNETIKSNKILVTLVEWETFIISVAKVSGTLRPANVLNILGDVYRHDFPYMNNMTKDLMGIKIDSLEQNTTKVTYKFHLYLKNNDKNAIGFKMFGLNTLLHKRFSKDSFIKLATACTIENHITGFNNIITWPFGRAGPIYPERTQCQGKNGEPIPGTCVPNFTDGAKLILPPLENCERFDACPRGYVNVNTMLCVSVTKSSPWEIGFKEAYVTGQEYDILKIAEISDDVANLYHSLSDLSFIKTGQRSSWVSMRRIHKYWPLVSLRSGTYASYLFHYSSWVERHPLYDKECVGFDFVSEKLFSAACDESLPFITVIDMQNLENAISPQRRWTDSGLVSLSSDQRCSINDKNGIVPTYDTGSFTCILQVDIAPSTWNQANKYCKTHEANLPQPFLGFMNWIYKSLLIDFRSYAVYMNLGNSDQAVMIDDPKVEYYDWMPDTDFKKLYGVLSRQGWTLTNVSQISIQSILCEKREETKEHSEFVLTIDAENSILVNIQARKNIKTGTIKCYRNGNLLLLEENDFEGLQIIHATELGYYKCFAWTTNPTKFVQSNTILLSNYSSISVFSVKFHYPRTAYRASVDDRTFWNSSAEIYLHYSTLLEVVEEMLDVSNATMNLNFFTPDEFEEGKYEYAHLTLNHDLQEEDYDESYWLQKLRTVHIVNENWTLEDIRPTTGCEENIFYDVTSGLNLTFQRTFGSGEFLAEELCVDSEGAPVSRTCHGDFLEGYFWSDALSSGCGGSPSTVTKQLHDLLHNVKDYQSGTYATLTQNKESLQSADVHFVAVGLQNIAKKQIPSTNESTRLGLEDLVSTVNNVLGSPQENFQTLNDRLNSTNILLESFERLSLGVSLNATGEDNFEESTKPLISVKVLSLSGESSVIGYADREDNGGNKGDVIREGQTRTLDKVMARIILPQNLTKQVASESAKKVHLGFSIFRSGKLFNERRSEDFNYTLNSYVIQASYEGVEVRDLEMPVEIIFRPLQGTADTVCAFWDFSKNDGVGGFLWKAAICAWGLPFIPIICLLVYDSSLYESRGQFSVVTGNSVGLSSYTSAAVHSQSRNMSGTSDSNNKPKLNDSSSTSCNPVVFSLEGKVLASTEENQAIGKNKVTLTSAKSTKIVVGSSSGDGHTTVMYKRNKDE